MTTAGRRLSVASGPPERTHVMVDGRLLEAVEVRVERVVSVQSTVGVQSDVAGLFELVPDKRQRVDEVSVLAANLLTLQFFKCHA